MRRVSSSALAEEVAGKNAAVLIHTSWCVYCRAFRPVFERALSRQPGFEALEVFINDEADPFWVQHCIQAVPAVFLYENGKLVARLDAALGVGLTERELAQALERLTPAHPE